MGRVSMQSQYTPREEVTSKLIDKKPRGFTLFCLWPTLATAHGSSACFLAPPPATPRPGLALLLSSYADSRSASRNSKNRNILVRICVCVCLCSYFLVGTRSLFFNKNTTLKFQENSEAELNSAFFEKAGNNGTSRGVGID